MQNNFIKIGLIIVGILIALAAVIWLILRPSTPTQNQGVQNNLPNSPFQNSTGGSVNNTSIHTTKVPDFEAAYSALFSSILASKVQFTDVTSDSTGDASSIYSLYKDDFAFEKKITPTIDYPISVSFIDLTNDGIPEALVYENLPDFCGTGGCSLDVYRKQDGKWIKIYSTLAQGDIGLSNTINNGYLDLFLTVSENFGNQPQVQRYVWSGKQYVPGEVMAVWNGSTFQTK